ncbi:hypothetical protein [Endozoicomonas arenosclerae]|uniref:hypothetical protein n=1 Tax=Endozoicomonas arenosclerae TaxID=1633495 RepID=UPI000785B656|nr:hypothetical protein [Endozoicomonas arenosclerae]
MAFRLRALLVFLLPVLAMAEDFPAAPDLDEMTELVNTLQLEQFQTTNTSGQPIKTFSFCRPDSGQWGMAPVNNQTGYWLSGGQEKSVHVADCQSDNPDQAISQFRKKINNKVQKDQHGGHWVSLPGHLCYQGVKDKEVFTLCHQSRPKHQKETGDDMLWTGLYLTLTSFMVQFVCIFSCGCCCGAYWVNQC